MCHVNLKSMNRNFQSSKQCLADLKSEFPFIGVSETWLTDNNYELYNLSWYNATGQQRVSQPGGVGSF